MATEYEMGVLVGLLIGEGHFGGDGRQPQVTLRMHERHEAMFRWLERTFPGGRLYGPYEHGGRRYYQWMARGPYLRDVILPMLETRVTEHFDRYAFGRLQTMRERYGRQLGVAGAGREPDRAHSTDKAGVEGPMSAPPPSSIAPAHDAAHIFAALRGATGEKPSP